MIGEVNSTNARRAKRNLRIASGPFIFSDFLPQVQFFQLAVHVMGAVGGVPRALELVLLEPFGRRNVEQPGVIHGTVLWR